MIRYKEENILIIINALKKIIEIFIGPFLTAYFIKISTETMIDLSLYNIMSYFTLGVGGFIVGWIIRNKFQLGMFRTGVIINFFYILTIMILKEQILNYLPLIAFLYGFSAICYYYPYNLFLADKIKNKERTSYEFKKTAVSTITSIITPLILGGVITTTNFELTTMIILFVSLIQIILSFFLKSNENKDYKWTPFKSFKQMISKKDVGRMFWVEYLKGMNFSSGSLQVILVILIFNAFKTDLNLGILSSIASVFTIIVQYIYTKKLKQKNDKSIIMICSIIPIVCLLLLLLFTNNGTLILYYFCYTTLVHVLSLILEVRLFNMSNWEFIKNDNKLEYWAIREIFLNLGRITSYVLLLVVAIINKFDYLYYLMIILTLSIALMSFLLSKIKKYDNIE